MRTAKCRLPTVIWRTAMKTSGNGYSKQNGRPDMEFDAAQYADLIVQGQGKIEAITFDSNEQIEEAVRAILENIGEDPEREGLLRTPSRVAKMYAELTAGYHIDPDALINDAIFSVNYDEMVMVKNIDFSSLCEHHMLPFMGRMHVAYIPNGKVVGLSKIPRIV